MISWFSGWFKKEPKIMEPGPAWVHISKLRKAEKTIVELRKHIQELQQAPKKAPGWRKPDEAKSVDRPKGKPRKQ